MNLRSAISAARCAVIGLALGMPAAAASPSSEPYAGPKKTVFVDVVGAAESIAVSGISNDGLNAMLVDALVASGRFIVVERVALGDIQLEQELARSGAVTSETGASAGRMLGASAVVLANVTKFGIAAGGGGVQIALPFARLLGGAAGATSQNAVVEFSVRIIDTSTGQVVATSKASGTASSSDLSVSAVNNRSGANLTANSFKNTPLGEAAESAINTAVKQIVAGMGNVPWSASVVAFDDGKVYVSAGAAQNLKAGMTLRVYRKGKVLTDPATGVVLEVLMTSVGTIQIQSASDKTSIAILIDGEPPARGDIVKFG